MYLIVREKERRKEEERGEKREDMRICFGGLTMFPLDWMTNGLGRRKKKQTYNM